MEKTPNLSSANVISLLSKDQKTYIILHIIMLEDVLLFLAIVGAIVEK